MAGGGARADGPSGKTPPEKREIQPWCIEPASIKRSFGRIFGSDVLVGNTFF